MSSEPQQIGSRSHSRNSSRHATSPVSGSASRDRHSSIVRLTSPAFGQSRSNLQSSSPTPVEIRTRQRDSIGQRQSSYTSNGTSNLTAALAGSVNEVPLLQAGTPPRHRESSLSQRLYGSFDGRPRGDSHVAPIEDAEIIKRHLVQPPKPLGVRFSSPQASSPKDDQEFSSLRLQGGDITRQLYKWAEDTDAGTRARAKRSQSFREHRPLPESDTLDINSIRQPGGFRRDYLRRTAGSPMPSDRVPSEQTQPPPQLFTNSFLEFLTLYGHFAGEDLEEDDEALTPDEYFTSDPDHDDDHDGAEAREYGEDSALLTPGTKRRRRYRTKPTKGTNSTANTALLLLKSFVGTGVLFLPRAFYNGGLLFSSLLLLGVAMFSFYCFILLLDTRKVVEASFGDIGGILYGRWMRALILGSIVLSQIGFVSAYIVFTSENTQAFVRAVSDADIDIKVMVMMQLVLFLPLSLIRDIGKLGFTALIADAFILLGLIYLYYYDIFTIISHKGLADIRLFNANSWTLFIGTAIFTFEGVGLIIPIQESMARPEKFTGVLAGVMVGITVLMISIGALSYAAYGSATRTVVILNLPQDSNFVNAIQILYSLAILLSTPLQLFPAIRILENELFTRSGKYNPYIKWQKNVFRFFLVVLCALIAWGGAGDLDKFVSLVGSFACIPLVYIYPPMLHLRAAATSRWQKAADYSVVVIGLVGCGYTTALTISQWAGGHAAQGTGV